jgi:uncharacterized glyoxalase superfamily protein PhnB
MVRDVVASANYFRDCAGFAERDFFGHPADFAIVRRDGQALMLARAADPAQIIPHWKLRPQTINAYFWVDDPDALYTEMKSAGARIDYAPCTQPYGVREFGIRDLEDHDIAFGKILPR